MSVPSQTPDSSEWAAFFAAAVFGLHPVMTEGAGYVTGRSEELCALGFLGALIMARRAILSSSRRAAVLAMFAGLVAIGSNAGAIALPAVVLAYDAWVLRAEGCRRRLWLVYLPAMAILASAALLRLGSPGLRVRMAARGPLDTLLTESLVVWRYLALLIVPAGQTVVHQVGLVTGALDPVAWLAVAGLVAIGGAALGTRRTAPLVAVGAVWFFGTLAPSSSVIPLRDAMAEHRLYLPALGVLLALASVMAPALAGRRILRLSGAALLTILGLLTYQRTRVWSDPLRLWAEAVQRSPDMSQAHAEYAEELRGAGHCDRAVTEYQAARRLDPGDALAGEGLRACGGSKQ